MAPATKTEPTSPPKRKMRFRIMSGIYTHQFKTGEREVEDPRTGRMIKEDIIDSVTYRARRFRVDPDGRQPDPDNWDGDIIETDIDLHAQYDQRGWYPRKDPNSAPIPRFDTPDTWKFHPIRDAAITSVEGIDAEIARLMALREATVTQQTASPGLPVTQTVVQSTPSTDPKAALEAMTDQELRKFAEAEEIDLKGAKKREDMIRIILAAS